MELPIRVAVTLPIFVEFARDAGLANAEVISLIPAGADPHTYEFTAADIERMKGIDFFFLNGLGLDAHLQDVIEANRDETSYVIPFAPNIRSPRGGDITAEQAGDNPHLWLDPTLAYVYPEIVADEFIIYDGIRKDFYNQNFIAARARLLALQDEVQAIIDPVPMDRRRLVTLHNSLDHFARRFGLTQAASAGNSPSAPVADEEISRLAQVVRDQGIPAVFTEFGYDSGPMDRVAAAAGVPVCTLYSDIIGGDVNTYAELMLANAREIARCLGA
jgi:ABC-type Zn uptake system ZnuABC Zn-binding protein ZnuA